MPDKPKKDLEVPYKDVMLEAIKGIKNEILLYSIVIVIILINSAYLGIEILREMKLPLIIISTITLIIYFLVIAFPRAKKIVGEERKRQLKAVEKKTDSTQKVQINTGSNVGQVVDSHNVSINISPSQEKKRKGKEHNGQLDAVGKKPDTTQTVQINRGPNVAQVADSDDVSIFISHSQEKKERGKNIMDNSR